jgi:flagellar biosynthesis/type III secretory pathway protein FliH
MMDSSPLPETTLKSDSRSDKPAARQRKPKHQPFQAEYTAAQKRKAEAEARRKEREEADRQRQLKLEERERFRKAMAKARTGGKNGQRKLGRESKVLLERVRRMTGAD